MNFTTTAETQAVADTNRDNTKQLISTLSADIVAIHWQLMEKMLTANDSRSARINAILRISEAMNIAVKAAQDLETSFVDDHINEFFTDGTLQL